MNVQLTTLGETIAFDAIRSAEAWAQRSVTVFGKTYPQPRLTRWYGDVSYAYSGLVWEPAAMPALVARIRDRVRGLTGVTFNSVLCNLYRDGKDTVSWHADDEPIFGSDPVVASVSFGATRTFQLRPNGGTRQDVQSFELTDGSLFVMGKGVQQAFQHRIPRTSKSVGERINLTFRVV